MTHQPKDNEGSITGGKWSGNNPRYAVATQLISHSARMNWGMIQMEEDVLDDAVAPAFRRFEGNSV